MGTRLPGRQGCFKKEKPLSRPAGRSVLVIDQPGYSRLRSPLEKNSLPTSPADMGGSSGACGAAGRAGEGLEVISGK